ncbi:MAG: phospholipase A [Proteobacteria bacterium]|nr:phospholipase A [Pseudomonadota bacterium]
MKKIIGLILFINSSAVISEENSHDVTKTSPTQAPPAENLLEDRLIKRRIAEADQLSLIPYRENYLVYSYLINGVNQQPIDDAFPNEEHSFRDYELQFQLSFMVPLWTDILDAPVSLYGAYTNRSFWQFFDPEDSRPFRETNHEPELWVSWYYDFKWGDLNAPMIWFGFRHQSNGQYVSMSRGWNRWYVKAFADYQRLSFSLIHWDRLQGGAPEDRQYDYEKFIGNGEIELDYAFNKSDLGLKYAYSLAGTEFGSVTAEFSHPISPTIAFYVRYFNGYGESLIDVEYKSETISMGIKLNEW